MSDKPRVSVVIPSYNHAAYIGDAIESILSQSLRDFELIIVDDGSTDNSWEIIEHYAGLDNRIIAIKQENQGPSAAVNHALKLAKGDFVASHTSDDRSARARLEKQAYFLSAHAEYDAVGSFIDEIDEGGQIKSTGAYGSWFNVSTDINDPGSWVWRNMVASPTLMLRRSFFERYGTYDRDLVYTQDWEILIRTLSKGGKLAILPERLFQYRSHNNNLTHKNATRTFWEYAYISSKTLHPWLMSSGNENLVLRNIVGFLHHEVFGQLDQNERSALANALFHNFKGIFPDFIRDCNDTDESNRIGMELIKAYGQVQAQRDQLQAERDQLQAERDQLQAERDQLQAERNKLEVEMSSLTYRAIKKMGHVLQARLPPAYRLAGKTLRLADRIWRSRPIDSYLRLKTKFFDTRTVVNDRWPAEQPLVSIIIPCFNYGKYINQAIDSVLNQTFGDFEIIVVDDESTDPYTREVLAALDKPKTRLIRQKNQRVSMARNNGIKEARGKYICCLDADDLLTPTYLEKCLYWLETRNFDICYSWVQLFGNSDLLWKTAPFVLDELMRGNIVSTTAVFRKTSWEGAGGYSSEMKHGYEDWDFWVKMAKHGARGHRIAEPLFLYRKHGPSLTTETDVIHDKLFTNIQALHADLYNDHVALASVKRRLFRHYLVKNSLVNLLRQPARASQSSGFPSLNILLCVPWFDLGGSSVLMKELFAKLKTVGVQAAAIATDPAAGTQPDEGLFLYESFTTDCFNLSTFLEKEDALAFIEYLIKSRKIDTLLIVGSRLVYKSLPRLKKLFPDLKVVDQLYNTVGHVKSNQEFRSYIDLNLVANSEVLNHLIERGESAERIQIIPHGIDTAEFSPSNRHYLAQLARRTERQFTFGFMGRLSEEKRPQDIIKLAAKLPKCRFRIRGEGPLAGRLRKDVVSLGLTDRVQFDERFKWPVEFFANIDALIVPSEIEGLPLVLLEAMSLGLPVIATKVGHIPMTISHGDNGFTYDSGQIDQMLELADHLLKMPQQERINMGAKARETVVDEYSIAKCATRYFEAFQLLQSKRISARL